LLAPSPKPTAVEHTSRDVGIIAGVIVCVALFIALILVIIFYRLVVGCSVIFSLLLQRLVCPSGVVLSSSCQNHCSNCG